jgi:DHA1 family bicyclomycin/chloramphenicol resistance-like MFS transporter
MALLFIGYAFFGLVMAPVMVMALDDHGDKAGLASSLGGTLQMVSGGVMIVATGPFFDGTTLPMVASIAFCATAAFRTRRDHAARRAADRHCRLIRPRS